MLAATNALKLKRTQPASASCHTHRCAAKLSDNLKPSFIRFGSFLWNEYPSSLCGVFSASTDLLWVTARMLHGVGSPARYPLPATFYQLPATRYKVPEAQRNPCRAVKGLERSGVGSPFTFELGGHNPHQRSAKRHLSP